MIVVVLGMAYRYIFLLIDAARDMLESRRSRMVRERFQGTGAPPFRLLQAWAF